MNSQFKYADRDHAGRVLGDMLLERQLVDPIILALPRGGVPVAKIIAETLHASLDVLIVRKIGAPFNPEYGIGAMCEDLQPLFNAGELLPFEDLEDEVKEIVEEEKSELKRRIQYYRGSRELPNVKNRNIILVDDGLATGVTAAAAGKFLKAKGAKVILLAVPVGPRTVSNLLTKNIDEIMCPYRPSGFSAVGSWYQQFNQVTDQEVMDILRHYHPQSASDITI